MRRILDDPDEGMDYGTGDIDFGTTIFDVPATTGKGVLRRRGPPWSTPFLAVLPANGGSDDGAPGLRPEYDAQGEDAFVRGPDGNKIKPFNYSAK